MKMRGLEVTIQVARVMTILTPNYSLSEEKCGKHKRDCLFNDEDLRLQASMWVRENAVSKGGTASAFCQWVNETF